MGAWGGAYVARSTLPPEPKSTTMTAREQKGAEVGGPQQCHKHQ